MADQPTIPESNRESRATARRVGLLCLAAALVAPAAHGDWWLWESPHDNAEIPDQQQTAITTYKGMQNGHPLGQSFLPQQETLYRIDFMIKNRFDVRPLTLRLWEWVDTDGDGRADSAEYAATMATAPLWQDTRSIPGQEDRILTTFFPRIAVTPGIPYFLEFDNPSHDGEWGIYVAQDGVDSDGDEWCDLEDNCVWHANTDQLDLDSDGVGDECDNCPDHGDPDQSDFDSDGAGDPCDNCPLLANPGQTDHDGDSEGDRCDLDDGLIVVRSPDGNTVAWEEEVGYDRWNCYRGDLGFLKATGIYTQAPGSNLSADRHCGLGLPLVLDSVPPVIGRAFFYLTTGVAASVEGELETTVRGRRGSTPIPVPDPDPSAVWASAPVDV